MQIPKSENNMGAPSAPQKTTRQWAPVHACAYINSYFHSKSDLPVTIHEKAQTNSCLLNNKVALTMETVNIAPAIATQNIVESTFHSRAVTPSTCSALFDIDRYSKLCLGITLHIKKLLYRVQSTGGAGWKLPPPPPPPPKHSSFSPKMLPLAAKKIE